MANPYFRTFSDLEFNTYASIVSENIEMFGQTCYYIPAKPRTPDYLFGEDPLQSFENAYVMTAFINYIDAFQGVELFNKFGVQETHEMKITISQSKFLEYTSLTMPVIGHLIYFPWTIKKSIFEITYVEKEMSFYHLGKIATWEISGRRWHYSAEKLTADSGQQAIMENVFELGDNARDNAEIDLEAATIESLDDL